MMKNIILTFYKPQKSLLLTMVIIRKFPILCLNMRIQLDIEKQRGLLEVLGAIDGQLSAIGLTVENLEKEATKLKENKISTLNECQHIDEEGNLAIAGGNLYAWCQICGKLLSDDEIKELEEPETE